MSDERTCPVPIDVLGRIQRCDRALLPGRDRCLEHDHPDWGECVVGRRAADRQEQQT